MFDWGFDLYSYNKREGRDTFFGGISISFKNNGMVLRDGYEHDSDETTICEIENYYTINSIEFQKILSLIEDENKNESILSEYNNANAYYENLSKWEDKLLFISFLHYFKSESRLDNIIKMFEDNGINYIHKKSFY
jgi:hypothetical protein